MKGVFHSDTEMGRFAAWLISYYSLYDLEFKMPIKQKNYSDSQRSVKSHHWDCIRCHANLCFYFWGCRKSLFMRLNTHLVLLVLSRNAAILPLNCRFQMFKPSCSMCNAAKEHSNRINFSLEACLLYFSYALIYPLGFWAKIIFCGLQFKIL